MKITCTHPDHVEGGNCEERAVGCSRYCACCMGEGALDQSGDWSDYITTVDGVYVGIEEAEDLVRVLMDPLIDILGYAEAWNCDKKARTVNMKFARLTLEMWQEKARSAIEKVIKPVNKDREGRAV